MHGTGLRGLLRVIDGAPFPAYRRVLGEHELGDFRLTVVSVPTDPLGGPARIRLSIDRAGAGLRDARLRGEDARVVIEDSIVRAAVHAIESLSGPSAASAPGSGRIWVDPPGPELALRTTARVGDERLDLSLSFDLPASERRIRGQQTEQILFEHLPRVGMAALLFPLRRVDELKPRVEELARRNAVAAALAGKGLAALLPRSVLATKGSAQPALTTIETPHGSMEGLGIPTGITLILTGGVVGAGPWLRAQVSDRGAAGGASMILGRPAATVRATRRAFGPLDLRAFVRACPEVPDPERHTADGAPAPLAAAASLVEAFEAGARILVLDEDEIPTGASSRDDRIQSLLGQPVLSSLSERLPELRDRWGLSFLTASRVPGELYDAADTVLILRDGRIEDVSEARRRPARATVGSLGANATPVSAPPAARSMRVTIEGVPSRLKVAAWGRRGVRVGEDLVDLEDTALAGDVARLRAIAALLRRAASEASAWRAVEEVLDTLEAACAGEMIDRLEEPGLVDLAQPSRVEIAAALVRWKRVAFRVSAGRLGATAEDSP